MDFPAENPVSDHATQPPFGSTYNSRATDDSELSLDDSGPETPIHDLDSLGDDGVRIIKPYAVEEPDDEPDIPHRDLPRLPDRFERWQRDLSEYMDDLNYEADGPHLASSSPRKQGQKRKLAHTGKQDGDGDRRRSVDTQPVHERRSKKQRSDSLEKSPVTDSFNAFREPNGDESSWSDTRSTECSGLDTTGNSPESDEMDID
ncbi:unnamed protein product [Penicillium olsonii]|uniref:Uncharacterized protein n=1 Tax=Penicillium olsonii TaxID=99116 RepID=A0A9W4N872_PENOL|nr:unnamed protein product [Penicillium olsonii]CAG8295962.1 unnamed protein product [Penicillium olsonii]CAG8302089.1 unnamed protein product [Penicillium olsonii]